MQGFMKEMVQNAVLLEQKGRTEEVNALVATLANLPNRENVDGDGIPQPYGSDAIRALIAKGREGAEKALEREKAKRERAAVAAKQNALRSEIEAVDISEGIDAEEIGPLAERATELGAVIALVVDGDIVGLSLHGIKKAKGNKGGGKPAADQPREFLDFQGNRVVGSLTDWAKAHVPSNVLETAKHSGEGEARKLRGGKVLVTFLTNEQTVDGETFGPYVTKNDGEDFDAAVSAWKAAKAAKTNADS